MISKIIPISFVRRFLMRFLRRIDFLRSYFQFVKMMHTTENRFGIRWQDWYPCLEDKTGFTPFDRHYVYHTAWAARVLEQIRPATHIDISSCLQFASIVSAFIPVDYYDYRPPQIHLSGFIARHADLLHLPFDDNSIPSLSCMHVIEHIGLGRYGDPLDPEGDLKAISELKRVVAVSGNLLFVVPIGQPKIMFNAHRIYSHTQIIDYFSDFDLKEFALIPDDPASGDLMTDIPQDLIYSQSYGCGCFWFKKR